MPAKPRIATNHPTYLRRLAKLLTYKADIYGPHGRIYAFEGQFKVQADGEVGTLSQNGKAIDPDQLWDGNGRAITVDRKPAGARY